MTLIDFTVISSGSKGNAVVIENTILIDCGVPFLAIREYHKSLQLILLTHIHSDHFNRPTIRKLARERPTLRFGSPPWLAEPLIKCGACKSKIDIWEFDGLKCGYRFGYVEPFKLIHNVPNCGYKIHLAGGGKLLYATDTASMDGIKAKNYDLYLLESNHGQTEIVDRIRQKQATGEYAYERRAMHNHLSHEKAANWLYQNMGPRSRYVYLHKHEG